MATTGLYNAGAMSAMAQQKVHQAKGEDATAQLASGRSGTKASVKPTDQALSASMESMTKVLDQARINAGNLKSVIQLATKTLQNMRNTLSTMDALAAQAGAGELTDADRAQINAVMVKLREGLQTAASTTEFNGTKLFTGGAGSLSVNAAAVTEAGGVVAVANAFAAGIAAASAGYIGGTATDASVVANGAAYDYSVTVGDQTFKAINVTPAGGATMTLISEANPLNRIVVTFDAAVTAITNLATANSTWKTALGLDAGVANASFASASAAAGAQIPASGSVTSTALPGEYSVVASTDGTTATWKMYDSKGLQVGGDVTTATANAQNLVFSNGITLALGAGYDPTAASNQLVFTVDQGSAVSISSQTGAYSDVTTTVAFSGAQTSQLGTASLKLNAINLLTTTDAAAASVAIKEAMSQVSTMYGNLGAAMGNLELQEKVVADMSSELQNAISGYRDADIPAAITQQKLAEVMTELANIAQGKALQQSQQLLKLAQQA